MWHLSLLSCPLVSLLPSALIPSPIIFHLPISFPVCAFADGSAFFDAETTTWHYIVQMLAVSGKGGWIGAHFSLEGSSPFGDWVADARNPVITAGSLWNEICAGVGKHCQPGMVDEGTFHIVEKSGPYFYVTFHGYVCGLSSPRPGRSRPTRAAALPSTMPPLPRCAHLDNAIPASTCSSSKIETPS